MFRSSEEMLDGADAPAIRVYTFRRVGPGRYVVGVVLDRNDGTAPVIWGEAVCVKGPGEECGD
jgi:hypothetical protein